MKFTKMQGIGNDYVYVNCFEETVENPSAFAIKVSDRRFGIGSDGVILILPSDKADCKMDMYNLDGSQGKMCGNGIRCVGKYVYERGIAKKEVLTVETLSGIKTLHLQVEGGKVLSVRVNMGEPVLKPKFIPADFQTEPVVNQPLEVEGAIKYVSCVSMGNPHCVQFVDDTETAPVTTEGPKIECHPAFPEQVNVEYIQIINPQEIRMRVWERGSGETWACGTGACASVVACILNGKTERNVLVHLRGGDLKIEWDESTGNVYMTGPAEFVFDGEVEI